MESIEMSWLRPLIRPTISTPGLRDATSMHRPHPLRDTTSTRRPHPPREPRALHHLREQKSLSPQLRAHLAVAGSLTERVYSRMRPPMPLLPHFLLTSPLGFIIDVENENDLT
ncbi:hypothetical protein B0H13DRAFT_2300809 [Mycena leptocephala]|nr:hypothetical protein B0H13DRAFT_2300809 [Mycena leptocephala]